MTTTADPIEAAQAQYEEYIALADLAKSPGVLQDSDELRTEPIAPLGLTLSTH